MQELSLIQICEMRQDKVCQDLQVVVKDSLDKHFVSESDLVTILKKADLNPIKKPMDAINTDRIETELKKNEICLLYTSPARRSTGRTRAPGIWERLSRTFAQSSRLAPIT